MRAAIYARFSTDQQSERSIDDQVALCRAFAEREGYAVATVFEDRARSGGSLHGRIGAADMLAAAQAGQFDVLIVEALDRLSRDMEDLAGLHKRLTFAGVRILAVHEGEANTVLVGLRGIVGQLFREDGVQKTRRGLAGRVSDGLRAGGRPYGYRKGAQTGTLEIIESEAAIVRRIFAEYLGGKTPRGIAQDLNRERIAPPRGKRWNASTLNGSAQRHNGILRNDLYCGRLIWNRVRMVKDPETGRRVSRPNPREEWQIVETPSLAIVERETFERAQRKKASTAHLPARRHRKPATILSGILRCGACGAGMASKGRDKTGKIRIRCSAHVESKGCPDPRTWYLETIEAKVLRVLQQELSAPDMIAAVAEGYREERRKRLRNQAGTKAGLEKRSGEIDRELRRLIEALGKGEVTGKAIGARITALEAEAEAIAAQLAAPDAGEVVELHPAALKDYEARIAELQARLSRGLAAGDTAAAQALRDLVKTVTVFPPAAEDPKFVPRIQIDGWLDPLTGPLVANERRSSGGKVVAGEGLEPPTPGL